MRLENIKSHDPWETDTWEVDYFDEDCRGLKLKEPLLGVRVNGGTWLEVRALLEHIDLRKEQLNDSND
jgi:hypothetical protein